MSTRSRCGRIPTSSSCITTRKNSTVRDGKGAPTVPYRLLLSLTVIIPRTMTTKREILELAKKQEVSSLLLQFTDILGVNKNVEVPESQFEKALEGDIMFDGSSIEGFVRIEESDMVLKPDLETFPVLPHDVHGARLARVICAIHNPDGSAVAGCTRQALTRQIVKP